MAVYGSGKILIITLNTSSMTDREKSSSYNGTTTEVNTSSDSYHKMKHFHASSDSLIKAHVRFCQDNEDRLGENMDPQP